MLPERTALDRKMHGLHVQVFATNVAAAIDDDHHQIANGMEAFNDFNTRDLERHGTYP